MGVLRWKLIFVVKQTKVDKNRHEAAGRVAEHALSQ